MSVGKLVPTVFLLAIAAFCLAGQPHVFPGQVEWGNPHGVTVGPEEYLLDQGYKSGYMTRGFNYNGNLDDGTLFAIHPSQWRYGLLHG